MTLFSKGIATVVLALSIFSGNTKTALGYTPCERQITKEIEFSFVGDVMLADYKGQRDKGGFFEVYDEKGDEWFFDKVKQYFEDDDFTVINMENVFTDNSSLSARYKDENPGYWYKAETKYASPLSKASIEVADMNNNHTRDYGYEGLEDTKKTLDDLGIYNGSYNRNIYLKKDGVNITIICAGLWNNSQANSITEAVKNERDKCEILIVYFHGGEMMVHKPDDFKVKGAHNAIDAGADLVIGAHPHCLQPTEVYKGKTIVYSLGNFCYGGSKHPENRTVIYKHKFIMNEYGQKLKEENEIIPCYVYTGDRNNFQPAPIEDETEKQNVIDFMNGKISSPFGETEKKSASTSSNISKSFEVDDVEPYKMYIAKAVNERTIPDKSGKLVKYHTSIGEEVTVTGKVKNNAYNNLEYVRLDNGNYLPTGWLSYNKPVSVQLPVKNIMQNPELPNGCEITSLTIVMNYKGICVDKCDMADNYLPKWPDLTGDPEYYYLRNPRSNGFYCFAPALCTTIDNYNNANGTSIQYENLTGSDVSVLYNQIDNGNPVVVWGTLRWGTPKKYQSGLYSNLHCMVLSGYTDNNVTITDPIYGDTVVDRAKFEKVWSQMGSRALIVK